MELSAALFSFDDQCLNDEDVPAEIVEKLGTVEIWHQKSDDSVRLTIPDESPLRRACEHLRLFSSIEVRLVDHDWVRLARSFLVKHFSASRE